MPTNSDTGCADLLNRAHGRSGWQRGSSLETRTDLVVRLSRCPTCIGVAPWQCWFVQHSGLKVLDAVSEVGASSFSSGVQWVHQYAIEIAPWKHDFIRRHSAPTQLFLDIIAMSNSGWAGVTDAGGREVLGKVFPHGGVRVRYREPT